MGCAKGKEEMNITEALKTKGIRLSSGPSGKWMVWDNDAWEVYSWQHNQKTSRLVITTKDEDEAIKNLLSDTE